MKISVSEIEYIMLTSSSSSSTKGGTVLLQKTALNSAAHVPSSPIKTPFAVFVQARFLFSSISIRLEFLKREGEKEREREF